VEKRRTFSAVDLALFSAATWNPHLIHLDADAAKRDGLEGAVVQSHFVPAALLASLDDDPGAMRELQIDGGALHGVSWRNLGAILAGQEVTYRIERAGNGVVTWRAYVGDGIVAEGTLSFAHDGGDA
jgi:acyl dehydratase